VTGVPKLHDDEVAIDSALVERLLAEQFPQWAGLPARVVERSGTDNVTFRVGDELAVRLPRTVRNQGQVEKDLAWMPRLAPHVSLPIPEPLELGRPSEDYPFTWGVYRWLPGHRSSRSRSTSYELHGIWLLSSARCARWTRPMRRCRTATRSPGVRRWRHVT